MCLAAACGRWDAGWPDRSTPRACTCVGVRDLDPGEAARSRRRVERRRAGRRPALRPPRHRRARPVGDGQPVPRPGRLGRAAAARAARRAGGGVHDPRRGGHRARGPGGRADDRGAIGRCCEPHDRRQAQLDPAPSRRGAARAARAGEARRGARSGSRASTIRASSPPASGSTRLVDAGRVRRSWGSTPAATTSASEALERVARRRPTARWRRLRPGRRADGGGLRRTDFTVMAGSMGTTGELKVAPAARSWR